MILKHSLMEISTNINYWKYSKLDNKQSNNVSVCYLIVWIICL